MGFQNANGGELHGFGSFVIWPWDIFKGVCSNPDNFSTVFYYSYHEAFL